MAKGAETKPDALKGQEPVVVLKGPERLLQRLAIQNMERGFFSSTDQMAWPSNDIEATKCNWRMSWMRCGHSSLLAFYTMVIIEGAEQAIKEDEDPEEPVVPGRKKARTPRQVLEEGLASPFPNATLILQADEWRPGRIDRAIVDLAATVVCKPPSEKDVPAWIDRLAEDHKRQIDAEVGPCCWNAWAPN